MTATLTAESLRPAIRAAAHHVSVKRTDRDDVARILARAASEATAYNRVRDAIEATIPLAACDRERIADLSRQVAEYAERGYTARESVALSRRGGNHAELAAISAELDRLHEPLNARSAAVDAAVTAWYDDNNAAIWAIAVEEADRLLAERTPERERGDAARVTPAEIKAVRARLGLTQAELAALLPASLDALQNWEIARVSPPPYLRRALADIERELTAAPDVAYYTTSFGCTCPGNRNRGDCIHQEAVAQYEARQRVIAIQTKAPEAVEERRAYLAELIAEQARQASLLRTQGIRPIDDGDFMRRDEWIQKLRASLPPVTFRS